MMFLNSAVGYPVIFDLSKIVCCFFFKDIYESEDITPVLFTTEWLDEMQDNEVASQIVTTIEDYAGDIQEYLDHVMVQKALEALAAKSVVYYVEQLLQRATSHRSGRDSFFVDNQRALQRMAGDIGLIKEFFLSASEEEYPRLRPVIEREFEFFETVHETMSIAGKCYIGNTGLQTRMISIVFSTVSPPCSPYSWYFE